MKVAEIMQKEVEYVFTDTTVREISDLIFGRSINGVPVLKDNKVVGFITERDILAALYPTMQEIVEDPVHALDFSEIESRAVEILKLPASKIMTKIIATIHETDHIMKAEAKMLAKKIGRLPVLNDKDELVGVISKGDIFRAAIGAKIPHGHEESFYDWLAHHYDILVNWERRLKVEIEDLDKLFKKEKAKKIIDMGSSTGEHSLALAKKGYNVTGVETSSFIYKIANKKKEEISREFKSNVTFLQGKYKNTMGMVQKDNDAVLFMGNALPHILATNNNILKEVKKVMKKNGTLILQIANFDKIFANDGLDNFSMKSDSLVPNRKHAFLGFYSKNKDKTAVFTQSIFDTDGNKWAFSGMRSTEVAVLTERTTKKILESVGFRDIKTYGSSKNDKLFSKPFDVKTSDILVVVAKS